MCICAGMATANGIVQRAKRTGLGLLEPSTGLSTLYSIICAQASSRTDVTKIAVMLPTQAQLLPFAWQMQMRGGIPNFFSEIAVELETADFGHAAPQGQATATSLPLAMSGPAPQGKAIPTLDNIKLDVRRVALEVLGEGPWDDGLSGKHGCVNASAAQESTAA